MGLSGILWAVELDSFSDLDKLNYVQVHDGEVMSGCDQQESYVAPPGVILGIFSEDRANNTSKFEKYHENIAVAMAFWQENQLLVEED